MCTELLCIPRSYLWMSQSKQWHNFWRVGKQSIDPSVQYLLLSLFSTSSYQRWHIVSMVPESPGELFQPTHTCSHTPAPDLKILMCFIRGVLIPKIQCTSRGRIAECLDVVVTGQCSTTGSSTLSITPYSCSSLKITFHWFNLQARNWFELYSMYL